MHAIIAIIKCICVPVNVSVLFLPTDYASGACPRICPPSGEPVCGSDGVIYASQCEMRKKMCGKGKALLIIIVITQCAAHTVCTRSGSLAARLQRERTTRGKNLSRFFFFFLRNTLLIVYHGNSPYDFFIPFCILTDW